MKFKTRICSILEIEYPILQGGMAYIATGKLAGQVSKAGGLGIIGAGNESADVLAKEIKLLKEITDKPFAVNIMLLSPYVEEIIELVLKEKVPVITTGAGNPGKYVHRFKEIGSKVIPVVSSVALAKRMARLEVESIIVEGMEAGGHIGELTTMSLVPQIVDAVTIPVIAAGGIADSRGIVAALALGAEGVQLGTRFVCTEECIAHGNYKQAIVDAQDRDTVITGGTTGHPVRNLKNELTIKLLKLEAKGVSKEEIKKVAIGSLKRAVTEGDVQKGTVMAGQIAGLINEILPVSVLIEKLNKEVIEIIEKHNSYIGGSKNE